MVISIGDNKLTDQTIAFDQAESLTGIKNPVQAGQEILRNGKRTKWVIVKMGSKGSILVTKSSVSVAPAFKVPSYRSTLSLFSHHVVRNQPYMYHGVSQCNDLNLSLAKQS